MVRTNSFVDAGKAYIDKLSRCLDANFLKGVENLSIDLDEAWKNKRQVFICGNGGSAANAIHIANDFHYGVGACGKGDKIPGIKVEALSANSAIVTCLANDTGYENIYAHQLNVKANSGDVLITLSGSGNSKNIINAINEGKRIGMITHAIVAFDGGKCKGLVDNCIYSQINDMQIAEDLQLITGHLCMQWLSQNKPFQTQQEHERN